jgi:hypothetical protein
MLQVFTTNIGQVKVGDTLLPGVFESLEITGRVKMDQVEIQGKETNVTQAVGYDPATVRLTINLLPREEGGECDDQIAVIQRAFRQSKDQERPGVYRLVNKHVQARGVDEVIFSGLKTFEDNRSDKVLVICEFTEHVPIKVKIREATSVTPTTSTTSTPQSEPTDNEALPAYRDNWEMYWEMLPGYSKTDRTPAKDDRKPGLLASILAWLKGEDNAA